MRTTRPVLTVALLLAVATGCTASPGGPEPDNTTPSSAPQATASPSATPSPETEQEHAAVNAERAARQYYRVLDELAADPDQPLSRLKRVTSSVSLQAWQQELETFRADQWTATGTTQIVQLSVQTVSLDNSDPEAGVVPTVQIDVCYDVSEIDVVDADDTSVVPADRPDRAWERLQVANYDYAEDPDGAWRIASGETLEKAPCDAA